MSLYPPEQRCPRCRAPLPQGVSVCLNCGLALPNMGGAPRASRSGPVSSWQLAEPDNFDGAPPAKRFGGQSNSGPAMYRPGDLPTPGPVDPWGDEDSGTSFRRPTPPSTQWPGASGWSGPSDAQFSSVARRDRLASYRDWAEEPPEPSTGLYNDQTVSAYGSRRPFSSAPRQPWQPGDLSWSQRDNSSWQPGGPSWQQAFAGAPTAYPGVQPAYDNAVAPDAPDFEPPMQPPPRRGKKGLLLLLVALLLLGVVGGGVAYRLLRPRPVITVTSKYRIGSTPAGATTTTLHLTGSQFALRSAVSFLLDGQPEPGHQILQSDANGTVAGDLTVTDDWVPGQHSLTARDASGNTTAQGQTIIIVPQGEANTPGPNGAPADDTPSFILNLIVHAHDKDTGQTDTYTYSLVVTGQPDPAGGTVCNPAVDTGKPQSEKGTTTSKVKYTLTFTATCSGTYKGGKITYTQTFSDVKIVYSTGLKCTATAAFVNQELDGSFTSATEVSGTLSGSAVTLSCNGRAVTLQGTDGTWTGSLSS